MRQGEKPGKSKAETKRSVDRKSPKNDALGRRELEKRLAEAQKGEAEALEQQTATSEILRVISSSSTDVQPVFEAVLASAARLCDALDATMFRVDGDVLRLVAHEGPIPSDPIGTPRPLTPATPSGRAALEGRTIQVADIQADVGEYPEGSAFGRVLTAVHRPANRTPPDLCRPGGHCHRERAPVQRNQGDSRAADRDGRHPPRDLPLTERYPARLRCDRSERRQAVRGNVRHGIAFGW